MLWAVSRAPLAELQAYKRQKGWTFPWASSFGGDFNFDFNVSFTAEQLRDGAEYNFRRDDPVMEAGLGGRQIRGTSANATTTGTDVATYTHEREGMRTQALSASRGCAQRPVEHTHPRSSRCPCRKCAMRSDRDRSQCHLGCALASVRRNAFRGREIDRSPRGLTSRASRLGNPDSFQVEVEVWGKAQRSVRPPSMRNSVSVVKRDSPERNRTISRPVPPVAAKT